MSRDRRPPDDEQHQGPLLDQVILPEEASSELAWIEVIQKMDEVYADLVRYQVELEEKNNALEEAKGFIDNILAAMPDVLLACDTEGGIQRVNRALEQLSGQGEGELLGRRFTELLDPPSRIKAAEFAQRMREGGVQDCEVSLETPAGPAPLAMNCTPRFDAEGRWVGMVLIGRPVGELRRAYQELDRTHRELQQAQRQLIQSEKMASLGRLVAGVAHELNNPISFVYGNIHSLQRYRQRLERYLEAVHQQAPPQALERLRRQLRIDRLLEDLGPLTEGIEEGAKRVADIVQALKRFSSVGGDASEVCDLGEIVHRAVHWVAKGEADQVKIQEQLPRGLRVRCHPGQLQQVIMNLLQNAVDALEEHPQPRVAVTAEGEGDRVWVTVADNGPGIPPENLLKVFDPFFTTKPVGKGTGLGLSISYGLVENQGGRLTAGNRPEGGACFTLELPLMGEGE